MSYNFLRTTEKSLHCLRRIYFNCNILSVYFCYWKALFTLYSGQDRTNRDTAHKWLLTTQKSQHAWQLCWRLMQSDKVCIIIHIDRQNYNNVPANFPQVKDAILIAISASDWFLKMFHDYFWRFLKQWHLNNINFLFYFELVKVYLSFQVWALRPVVVIDFLFYMFF